MKLLTSISRNSMHIRDEYPVVELDLLRKTVIQNNNNHVNPVKKNNKLFTFSLKIKKNRYDMLAF